ncbi:hypothetical protein FB451DRAFT_1279095 [Mycena latifolia]|nr:hypothetical protein FB451DRAFT_1279095 [Mycena latifolia]
MDPGTLHNIALSASRIQIVKYVHVGSLVILLYDYLLTMDLEAALIWPSKRSLTKTLFLLSRYSPFVDVPLMVYYAATPDISINRCLHVHITIVYFNLFGIAVAEIIFVLRTYAISGQSRTVLIVFITICTASLAGSFVLLTLYIQTAKFGPPLLATLPGCYLANGTLIYVGISFIIALSLDICIFVYTLWIGIKKYRHSRNPLIVTLYRDGITYFAFLCIISATNFAILLNRPLDMPELLNNLLRVMHSLLSCRVILHVREVEQKRAERSRAGLSMDRSISSARFEGQEYLSS